MFGIFKENPQGRYRSEEDENRDAVEATVWGAYSIAYADGTCDAKEIAVLEKDHCSTSCLCAVLR